MKTCRIREIYHKDVVNIKDGACLGCVNDIEVDVCDGRIVSIIIYGRLKCFGLLGRHDDMVIMWNDIDVIGEDAILVSPNVWRPEKHRKRGVKRLLNLE